MPPSDAHTPPDSDELGGTRPPDPRRALGRLGEDLAVAHLERRGLAILDRNARTRYGEIDVVSFDGATLAFVEVKTRRVRTSAGRAGAATARSGGDSARETSSDASAGPGALASPPAPLEGLRRRQRLRLRRLATAWLQDHPRAPCAHELRFDAIGVLIDEQDRLLRLDHLEGAW